MMDVRAEREVLAFFITGRVDTLVPELFSRERQIIARVLLDKGRPASPALLSAWLKGVGLEVDGVDDLFQSPAGNAQDVIEALAELAVRRQLVQAGEKIVKLARQRGHSAIAQAEACLRTALAPLERVRGSGITEDAYTYAKAVLEKETPPGWKLNFSPLLSRLTGPLGPSVLMMLSGEPGVGKTTLALQIALDLAKQGVKSAYFSVDMGAKRLLLRAATVLSGVPYALVRRQERSTFQAGKAQEALAELRTLPLTFEENPDVMGVSRKVREGCQFVVYDTIQLAYVAGVPNSDIMTTQEAVTAATRLFRSLASQAFILVVSHKKPHEQELSWSKAQEQQADIVVMLEKRLDTDLIRATFTKNRDGPLGTVPYYFYQSLFQMVELTTESAGFEVREAR